MPNNPGNDLRMFPKREFSQSYGSDGKGGVTPLMRDQEVHAGGRPALSPLLLAGARAADYKVVTKVYTH